MQRAENFIPLTAALADTKIVENGCVKYLETGKVYNVRFSIFGLLMDTGVDGNDLQGRRWKAAMQPWCCVSKVPEGGNAQPSAGNFHKVK
jgi:hypothetical protein